MTRGLLLFNTTPRHLQIWRRGSAVLASALDRCISFPDCNPCVPIGPVFAAATAAAARRDPYARSSWGRDTREQHLNPPLMRALGPPAEEPRSPYCLASTAARRARAALRILSMCACISCFLLLGSLLLLRSTQRARPPRTGPPSPKHRSNYHHGRSWTKVWPTQPVQTPAVNRQSHWAK